MKIIQVILLLFLVIKVSTDVDKMVLSLITGSGSCCHSEVASETLLEETADTKKIPTEKKGNCCGDDCSCMCCGFVYTLDGKEYDLITKATSNHRSDFGFQTAYFYLFADNVWQPPRLV